MPIVALPDGREVEFPEGASPDLIQGALRKDFPQFFGGIDRAARKAELQAQQAAAREEGVTTSFSARAGAGIEQGLRTPEVMLRGGLDALQYYRALDAVTGSGDKYQQQNQAQLKAFNDRDAFLARETQAIEGREGRNFVGDLVQGVARGVVELPPQLMAGAAGAARGAAVKASAMMGGAQGGLTQFAQDRGEGRSQLEAMPNAIASGLITAVTTRAFGDSGVEAVFRNEGVQGFRRRLVSVLREAGMEGAEEFTDQVQQDLLERATRNPGKPLGDTFYDTMQALGVGAVIGGGVNAPRLLPPRGTTVLPDGREVIVNQETGTTEFSEQPAAVSSQPPAAQLSTLNSQLAPATAVFRGLNGEDIRVGLGGATLEQAQAAIFRQQPGAEFVGVEGAVSPISPPETVPPEATPASTPQLSTSPTVRGEAAMETRPTAEMGLDRTRPSTLNPELSTDLAETIAALRAGYRPEVEKAAQEPWQMTREEYRKQTQKDDAEIRLREPRHEPYTREEADDLHRRELTNAIKNGKPVPAEVLADYPDLKPAKLSTPAPVTPAATGATAQKMPWEMRRFDYAESAKPNQIPAGFDPLDALAKKNNRSPYNPDAITDEAMRQFKKLGWISGTKNFKLTEVGRNKLDNWRRDARENDLVAGDASDNHIELVEKAIREGKPVPAEVLADYPDIKPPAQPGVATNTVAEQPTQPSGGQSTVAQPAPAAKAKRVRAGRSLMGRFNAETERMGPDILDFIIQSGGMLSKAGAKAKGVARWKLIASEYDDARTLAVPHHNLIYRGLRTPDKVAQAAYDKGLLSEASVPELWQAISDASRVRHAGNKNPSREEKFLQEEAAAAERWSKATESGRLAVTTEQLVVGDVLAVEGVRVAVTERDPETGRLTLQDGREFETQFLEDDQIIYVEAWLEKTPAQAPLVDDWDTADPVPQPVNPSAPDFFLAPAESVAQPQPRKLTKDEAAEYSELETKRRAAQEGGEGLSMAEAKRYSELTAIAGQQELLVESGTSSTAGRVSTLQAKLAEVERLEGMATKRLYQTAQGSNARNLVMAEVRGYSDVAAQLRAEIDMVQNGPKQAAADLDLFGASANAADASVRDYLGGASANPFLDPKFWQAVAVSGARMLRDLGQFTVTQAKWSAAMLKKFGQGIQQALAATWNRLMRLQTQQTNGVSAIGQGHLNQIEAASVNANIAEEQKPVYSEQDLAKGAPGLGIRLQPMSKQIAFLGGKVLLGAKQKLDVTGALQAAAVKKQSDNLWQQLVASSAAGNPLTKWKLPAWLIGSPRARAFKQRVLHIAARLNATGRDAAGNFTFADFTMRAGTMSLATAKQSELSVGDQFTVNDPLTGVTETLTLGPIITTPEGRVFHQLARPVDGATQAELYQHFAREYPEMIWFLDMFIDPALAGLRQTINGIEVPVFNRFAAAAMMADGNPNFSPLTAYTPDVLVTRSLIGAIRGAWHKSGVRSPGRKYKSGTSREGGHVRDLLSGFNVRTWQMLQEKSRREWMQAVLKRATPIRQNQVPEGWVKLETGMEELWQAVKRLRNWKSPVDPATGAALFPETEQRAMDDGSAEYKAFFLEAMKLRGKQLMLPQTLVDQLVRKYVAHVEHGTLYRLGSWLVRNSTQLFLVAPVTVVNNVLTNDMFTLQAATRRILSGVAGGKMQDLRFARDLFTAEFFKWFPGLRTLVDPQWRATMNADVLPENLFADQTMLADLKVRLDEDPLTYLRQGEIGAAALNFIRYGNIDTRAKTRMAYAWLRAQAVTNARKAGLRGAALRASVDAYLANPPIADMAAAVEVAGFELLNYADSPAWLEDMASGKFSAFGGTADVGDFGRLVMPFPRFGYHFIAKTAREAAAVKVLLGKVPKGQRADAFADLITFLMWPAGGLGILAAYGLKGLGDDDDEARKRVGTASIKTVDADGNMVSKPLPRDLITSNRINLSAWARGLGLGTDREEDFWLRVRSYPVIAMAGAALLAEEDARKFGAAEGAQTYAVAVKDLALDFFSVGMAVKVPSKVLNDLGNTRHERTFFDPYASGVPTVAYVVDQTLDSFLPGTRQFDIAVKWMDPIARRRGASKTLGFDPTVWDAARVGHVTGLMDRLFAGADGTTASTLPPEGKIDRRSGTVPIPQEYTLQQRIAELVGFNLRPIDRSRYEEALSPYATRN